MLLAILLTNFPEIFCLSLICFRLQWLKANFPGLQVGDDTPSRVEDLPVNGVGNEQAKSRIDPNLPGGEEPTGAMGEAIYICIRRIVFKDIVNCQNTLDKGVPRMQQWPTDIPQ